LSVCLSVCLSIMSALCPALVNLRSLRWISIKLWQMNPRKEFDRIFVFVLICVTIRIVVVPSGGVTNCYDKIRSYDTRV